MHIYFDNAASTKPRKEVINEMLNTMESSYANADALHSFGYGVLQEIKKRKIILSDILGVDCKNVYFTSGGGDGNNIILKGIIAANCKRKKHIITTKIEHPSVYEVFREYEKEEIDVSYIDVNEKGQVVVEELINAIREDTIIVSIGAVNSEIGTIQNIEKLIRQVKEKNKDTYFHTDFVQGLLHTDMDFRKLNIDAITISSHKVYGPKGVGAIYIKDNVKVKNLINGSNPENGVVPRTLANELILGFLKAVEIGKQNFESEFRYVHELRKYFVDKLEKNIEDYKINSLVEDNETSSSIVNVSFLGAGAEVLLHLLESEKIYVSTGSACSSKKQDTRVLTSLGLSKKEIDGAIRFSFSIYNTKEEIDKVIDTIKGKLSFLRSMR